MRYPDVGEGMGIKQSVLVPRKGDAASYVARWEIDGVSGIVVAVDVLRAFTTAAYAFAAGASSIWLVGTVEEALERGQAIPGSLVMGEEHGRRPSGFDFSNSPVDISHADVVGRCSCNAPPPGRRA